MMINALTSTAAMLFITLVLLYAISEGIDGAMLAAGIAIIAGLGGYSVNRIQRYIHEKRQDK